ncbi:Protein of unknown function [Pyronema omphalodes CBS 100304]|uniref:Uncharacterized protein n=1 Tax=Pyronema omphalodes (strain CBS 100304) TaxID=1076935 RepID=U4L6K4_PYROM|nr:Protein of unknown function [Pyronema omphalodes CBS 100304]
MSWPGRLWPPFPLVCRKTCQMEYNRFEMRSIFHESLKWAQTTQDLHIGDVPSGLLRNHDQYRCTKAIFGIDTAVDNTFNTSLSD